MPRMRKIETSQGTFASIAALAKHLGMPYANVKAMVSHGRADDLFSGLFRGYDPARLVDVPDRRIACGVIARRMVTYDKVVAYVSERIKAAPGLTLDATLLTTKNDFIYAPSARRGPQISLFCGDPHHPVWSVDAGYLLLTQRWCGHCSQSVKKTLPQVKRELHARGYTLLSGYKNANSPIKIRCPNGHVATQTLSKIVNGHASCPRCFSPREEAIVQHYLEYYLGIRFDQVRKRPAWLYNLTGQRLELDGFCTEWRLAFEYQGEHHYKTVGYSPTALSTVQARDAAKAAACKQAGVSLIVVPNLSKGWNEPAAAEHVATCLRDHGFAVARKAADAPKFIKREPEKLSVFRGAVDAKGGVLLEEAYKGYHRGHLIRCGCGHEWEGSPASIFRGCWCPKCGRLKRWLR